MQSRLMIMKIIRGKIVLFCVIFCVLGVADVKAGDAESQKYYYTRANIWFVYPKRILSVNYHEGTMIRAGTRVTTKIKGKKIKFTTDDNTIYTLVRDKKHSSIDIDELFDRYFLKENVMLEKGVFYSFTKTEQDNIKKGKIEPGMSKDAVLMAYGYPPNRQTPDLSEDIWWYYYVWDDWEVRRISLLFEGDKLDRIRRNKDNLKKEHLKEAETNKAQGDEGRTKKKIFGYYLNIGTEQSSWRINSETKTEGLNLYRINGDIKIWDASVFEYHCEQLLSPSAGQKEILLINKSKKTGAEKYSVGIIFDPIAERYFTDRRLISMILKRLCSIKIERSRELFWGQAKVLTSATYVPIGTNIDYENEVILDGKILSVGDELSFRTMFTDLEVSMALITYGSRKYNIADSAFRLGYTQSKWDRLTDTEIYGVQLGSTRFGGPILYEANFSLKVLLSRPYRLMPACRAGILT